MRLADAAGACVDLRIAGYQFPELDPEQHEWDANWLIIAGSVRTAGGASWSFRDPALTTWEVADAMTWLRRVSDGAAAVAAADHYRRTTADDECVSWERLASAGWLTFTEPNLSFAVGGSDGQEVQLLVGLGHESAEPPVDPQRPGWCRIAGAMSREQVQSAADALQEELATYPAR